MVFGAGYGDAHILFLYVLYKCILFFSGKSLDVHTISLFLGGPLGLFQL